MRNLIWLCLLVLTACQLPKETAPDEGYLPQGQWLKTLNLKAHFSSRIDRCVGRRDGQFVIVEAGLSQVRMGQRVIYLPDEARLWRGEIYLSRNSLNLMQKIEFKKKTPKPPAHPEWLPPGPEHQWKYIVVHHSDTSTGSAAIFHRYHVETNGWDELGYHFVIGNGSDSGLGEVEIGSRWTKQKTGAHAKSPGNLHNRDGIGVCLVGSFSGGEQPASKQMAALIELVRHMQKRFAIPKDRILRHKDVKITSCPGDSFPWELFKSKIRP